MRPRQTLAASGLALLVATGAAVWARPILPTDAADPSLALRARTAVPPRVMATLRRACFDCHSTDTRWPWYARLPVAGHVVVRDVREGRAQLDWSRWEAFNRFDRAELLDKVCELATRRVMPPWPYRLLHPDARLSAHELRELCDWSRHESARLIERGS
jgi:hypothetical protein